MSHANKCIIAEKKEKAMSANGRVIVASLYINQCEALKT